MKTVYLVRHGKSGWKEDYKDDIDRQLKEKGILEMYELAKKLVKQKIMPDFIVSSIAIRSVHSAVILSRTLGYPVYRLKLNDTIYACDKDDILNCICQFSEEFDHVMLVAHDPAITNFANLFLTQPIEKMPTSSTLAIRFKTDDWSQIQHATAKKLFFFSPKKG